MHDDVPFKDRKQLAYNHQTILLSNNLFENLGVDENDEQIPKTKILSCKNILGKFSKKNLLHKEKPNTDSSNFISKFVNDEVDFDELDSKNKDKFLKLRGRKLKDYLSDYLKNNELEQDIEDEEEGKNHKEFCLDHIFDNNLMEENIFDTIKIIENIHNQSRSRTTGPIRVDSKRIINLKNENEEILFCKLDDIDIGKPRKLTFSHHNQYLKTKRKKIFSNDNVANEKDKFVRKTILNPKSLIDFSNVKSRQFNGFKTFISENKKDTILNHTSIVDHKKSFNSISSFKKEENFNSHSNRTNYLSLLNKQLSSQKLTKNNLVTCKLKKLEKRGFVKFKNVYDSLSDDENEEYLSCKIYPDSEFKEIWDYVIFFITIYTLLYVPYDMAFANTSSIVVVVLDLICDLIYIADLILQFLIPISLPNDKYNTSLSSIAKNYFETWFTLDFLSSVPLSSVINLMNLNLLNSGTTSSHANNKIATIAKLSRIYRMMKLVRLLKLIKISKNNKNIKYMDYFQNIYNENLRRLFMFLLYFFVLNHMLACIWVFIGGLDFPNWIVKSNLSDNGDLDLYVASIYFNLTTIFTIGYGDITSMNNYERIYNIIIMCVGIMLYTFAVSSLSNLFQKKDLKTKKLESNLAFLEDISLKHDINNKLYLKIKQCLKYDYIVNREDKFKMLSNFPEIIKIELINEMHKDIISNFLFFKNTNSAFRATVMMVLKPHKAKKGEILIKENEFVEEMFFIKKGVLSIIKNYKEQPLKIIEIRRNEHFGEIFMLMNERSSFGLVVKSDHAELFLMKKADLFEIYGEYQSILESILHKSTYNSLMLLKKFKIIVNSFKDRRNLVHNKTEKTELVDFSKSIFRQFLKKDDEMKLINKSKKTSVNFLNVGSIDQGEISALGENVLSQSPREIKFHEDFKVIIEENEDEVMVNLSSNSYDLKDGNFGVEQIEHNTCFRDQEDHKQPQNLGSKFQTLNKSPLSRTNSFEYSNLKSSISDHLKYSLIQDNDDNSSENPRSSLRKLTESGTPSKNLMGFEKITKKIQSSTKTETACSPLNIRTNDRSIRRKTMIISKEINKNIMNDSINIKTPAQFYFNKFEKWTLRNQIKKLEKIMITFQQIVKKVEGKLE